MKQKTNVPLSRNRNYSSSSLRAGCGGYSCSEASRDAPYPTPSPLAAAPADASARLPYTSQTVKALTRFWQKIWCRLLVIYAVPQPKSVLGMRKIPHLFVSIIPNIINIVHVVRLRSSRLFRQTASGLPLLYVRRGRFSSVTP